MQINMWRHLPPQVSHNPLGNTERGHMTLLKWTLFCVFGAMQCVYVVQKTQYFPHTVHNCCFSMPLIFTTLIVRRSEVCSDWPAIRCAVIGQIPQACELLRPSLYCDAMRRDTKTIKPIINKAFIASSGDIITDYNDSYGLFTRRICDRRNDKQQALLYTAQNSRLYRR